MNAEAGDDFPCAYRLDGAGGADRLSGEAATRTWQSGDLVWLHIDRDDSEVQHWLREQSGLDGPLRAALMAADSRPHCAVHGDGMLLALRGVNLNPGAQPEDMVAIRIWTDGRRIISSGRRRLMAIDDLRQALEAGRGPLQAGQFLADIADRMVARIGSVIYDLEDEVDLLEETVMKGGRTELGTELAMVRRHAIRLRRYLAPQRDAMDQLIAERPDWLEASEFDHLRAVDHRLLRYVEDLDAARERAQVVQDEMMNNRLYEQTSRLMYLLMASARRTPAPTLACTPPRASCSLARSCCSSTR